MPYYEFQSTYDAAKKSLDKINSKDFYNDMRRGFLIESERSGNPAYGIEHNRCLAESIWVEDGRPYYKVDNSAIELFSCINIDIPFRYLKLPFESFLIRFEENNPLIAGNKRNVQSMLVTMPVNTNNPKPSFYLWVDCGEREYIPPHPAILNYIHLHAGPDDNIAESIGSLPINKTTGSDLLEIDRRLVSIAVSVCFLATSSDKIIVPDVLSKDLSTWLDAVRRNDLGRQKTIIDRAVRRGKQGYIVDGAREFLRPEYRTSTSETDHSGRSLTHRHVRSAHFRRIKGDRVVFVRQAIVRPDLPPQ